MVYQAKTLVGVLLVLLTTFAARAGAQDADSPVDEHAPIENSQFWGVKTTATITRRFEIYDPHSLADLQAVKAMGFDQVILDRAPLHAQATALGLDVVLANWWTDTTPGETIEESLRLAEEVQPGRLAGISVMDEPERNSPDTPFQFYVDLYERLKPRMQDKLAGVRLEISYWGPLSAWDQRYYDYFSYLYEAADVMRIMPYPDLHESELGDVYLMLQRSKRAMKIAEVDLPHVVILQTWVLPPQDKLPTIAELRVMAYQAMLGGAETLSFFEYNPNLWSKTPGFTEQFRELMVELRALSERLEAASIESTLLENGVLEATAVWTAGRVARILVNTNRQAEAGLVGLEIQDGSLPVVQVANNDSFNPVPQLACLVPPDSIRCNPSQGLQPPNCQPCRPQLGSHCQYREATERCRWFPRLNHSQHRVWLR